MRNLPLLFIFLIYSSFSFATSSALVVPSVVISNKNAYSSFHHISKTTITQKEIATLGASSLAQALQELGGVQLQDITGNNSQVSLSLRGFGINASSNTLLLVNGIPMTNPDLAPPDLNSIPIQEIELIEIIAGSESVLYGDQAVGGIINITTKEKNPEKIGLSCSAGSYNQKNCIAFLSHQFKQFNYIFNASKNHTDNYRQHNEYDQHHLSGHFRYDYLKGSWAFNFQFTKENMEYPGALTSAQVSQNRRQANNSIDFFKDWNDILHLKNIHYLNSTWLIETDLSHRQMNGNGILTSDFKQSRDVDYLRPVLKGSIGNILLNSGIDVENDHYRLLSLYGTTNDAEKKYGIFTLLKIPINSIVSFSVGARGAQQNNTLLQNDQTRDNLNRALASTLSMGWKLMPTTEWYLRRAESFRFPKADENASTLTGGKGLKTQRGVSYETGIQINRTDESFQLGIFQLNLRDEITFDPTQTTQQPFGSNRNLSPTARHGFTLSGKYDLTRYITLDGQYNYVNAEFQSGSNAGNRIPLVSESLFHGGINYKITSHWNFYSEAIYTGSQYAANDDANRFSKLGGYTIYNLNLRYQFHQFSAAFRINNIFNKFYYFYATVQPGMTDEFFYPAPERNFLLTLKYVFA